jgi:uncharacterized protein (DUF4213/DUF364 family)
MHNRGNGRDNDEVTDVTKIGNKRDIVKKMSELFSLAPIIHLVLENYCLLIISSSNSLCKRKICGFGGESKHLIGCLWWALRYLAVDKWIVLSSEIWR